MWIQVWFICTVKFPSHFFAFFAMWEPEFVITTRYDRVYAMLLSEGEGAVPCCASICTFLVYLKSLQGMLLVGRFRSCDFVAGHSEAKVGRCGKSLKSLVLHHSEVTVAIMKEIWELHGTRTALLHGAQEFAASEEETEQAAALCRDGIAASVSKVPSSLLRPAASSARLRRCASPVGGVWKRLEPRHLLPIPSVPNLSRRSDIRKGEQQAQAPVGHDHVIAICCLGTSSSRWSERDLPTQ